MSSLNLVSKRHTLTHPHTQECSTKTYTFVYDIYYSSVEWTLENSCKGLYHKGGIILALNEEEFFLPKVFGSGTLYSKELCFDVGLFKDAYLTLRSVRVSKAGSGKDKDRAPQGLNIRPPPPHFQ